MPIRTYEDFDLAIEATATGYRAKVLYSPGGEGSTTFTAPFSDDELVALTLAPLGRGTVHPFDRPLLPVRQMSKPLDPQTFGKRLFTAIFHDTVDVCLRYSLKVVERPQQGLRFRLHLNEAGGLAQLPWEYLYDPISYGFFALSDKTPIVRYLGLTQGLPTPDALRMRSELRILVVIANPIDTPTLDIEKEWATLQTSFAHLQSSVVLELLDKATLPRLQKRLRQLRDPIHILHYIGHGDFIDQPSPKGALVLEDEERRALPITAPVLGTLLRDCDSLRFVFLNGCEGARTDEVAIFAGVAQTLVYCGIPAVLAMQSAIHDQTAITLSATFYDALAEGYPIDAALSHARKLLYGQTDTLSPDSGPSFEWGTPMLFMRMPDGVIWHKDIDEHKIIAAIDQFQARTEVMAVDKLVDEPQQETTLLAQGIRHFIARFHERIQTAAQTPDEPYRGLLSYRVRDARVFFGRDQAIQAFLNRLHRWPLTVLHAESGAGKTSLIHAGLMPRLLADGHLPLVLRAYDRSPTIVLKQLLAPNWESVSGLRTASLHGFIRAIGAILGPQSNLYLFLDQFEEFFTQTTAGVQSTFLREFNECLSDETLNAYWILVIRTEYFGNLANLRPQIRNPFANDFRLNRLTRSEAQEVIVRPAALYNVHFADAVGENLLNELGVNQILPPQLQLVCRALYEQAIQQGHNTITEADYAQLGGVTAILRNHLGRVLHTDARPELRRPTQLLLEALVTARRQRVLRTKKELAAYLARLQGAEGSIDEILSWLQTNHIVREQEAFWPNTEPTYELAHDYLLDEIELSPEAQARKAAEDLLARAALDWREVQGVMDARTLRVVFAQRELLPITEESAEMLINSAFESGVDLADWLAYVPPTLAHATLATALKRPEATLRHRALEHFRPYFTPTDITEVMRLARNDADDAVRATALQLLNQVAPQQAYEVIHQELRHPVMIRRLMALDAATAYMKDAKMVEAVFERVIQDPDAAVWKNAATLLATRRAETERAAWQPLYQASFWRQEAAFGHLRQQHVRLPFWLKIYWIVLHAVCVVLQQVQQNRRLMIGVGAGSLAVALVALWLWPWWQARHWYELPGAPAESITALAVTNGRIYVGSRDFGLKISDLATNQWSAWLDKGLPASQPEAYTVGQIQAIAIDPHPPEQVYVHVWESWAEGDARKGIYYLEQVAQEWRQSGKAVLPDNAESGMMPLAAFGGRTLFAAGSQGVYGHEAMTITWSQLNGSADLPGKIFYVAAFDAAGVPYVGGQDGLYREIKSNDDVRWERLPDIPEVVYLAFGSDAYLYLGLGLDGRASKFGCYQLDKRQLWSGERDWNLLITHYITALAAHPTRAGRFYVGYSDGSVYEVDCYGQEKLLGRVAREAGVAALVIAPMPDKQFLLLQATEYGVFAYTLQ